MKSTLAIVIVAALAVSVYSQGWASLTWAGSASLGTNVAAANSWNGNSNAVPISCSNGYFLGATQGSCTACPTNCGACAVASTCLVCNQGFYLASGACTACATGCNACTSAAATSCTACMSGAYSITVGTTGCISTNLKFYAGKPGAPGTSAIGATCTTADGQNMGLCVSAPGAITAGTSGYDYTNAGAIAAVTGGVANCLAYSAPTTAPICM